MDTHDAKQSLKRKLDVSNASNSLWLVKIPQAVAEKWSNAGPNETLGTLRITSIAGQNGRPASHELSVQLMGDDSGSSSAATSEEFTLDEVPAGPQIYSFEHNKSQRQFAVKGRVSKRYNLKPKSNEQYRQVVRNRTTIASKGGRKIAVTKNEDALIGAMTTKEIDFIPPAYVDARKRDADTTVAKRTKAAVNVAQLKTIMLDAFSKQEFLSFKEIYASCGATGEIELRELLKKYAVYHSKGKLQTYYELKPEYRFQQK
jgi:hypothetical protein